MAKRRGTRRNGRRPWGTVLQPRKGRRGYGIRWPDPRKRCGYAERWGIPPGPKNDPERVAHQQLDDLWRRSHLELEGLAPRRIKEISFDAFIDEALAIKEAQWKPGTHRHATYVLKVAANEYFGKKRVGAIDVPEARMFLAFLKRSRSNSPNTMHRVVSLMSGVWELAIEMGYTRGNPWKIVKKDLPSVDKCQPSIPHIDKKMLDRIILAVPVTRGVHRKPGYRPVVELMANTGLRRSEMWNLRWRDVDPKLRWIQVRETKTGEDRTVGLTPRGQQVLAELRDCYAETTDRVVEFLGVKPETATVVFRRYMRAAGIEGVTLHTLRHVYATGLTEANVPANWIMNQTGHSKLKTLQRYTDRAPKSAGQEAAKMLAQLWGQNADNGSGE